MGLAPAPQQRLAMQTNTPPAPAGPQHPPSAGSGAAAAARSGGGDPGAPLPTPRAPPGGQQQQHAAAAAMQSSFLGASLRRAGGAFAPAAPASRSSVTVRAGYNNMVKLGGGKKWERQELTANGKPVKMDMHVKKGDVVQVRMTCSWQMAAAGGGGCARQPAAAAAGVRAAQRGGSQRRQQAPAVGAGSRESRSWAPQRAGSRPKSCVRLSVDG